MKPEIKVRYFALFFPLIPLAILLGFDWIPWIAKGLLWVLGFAIIFSCYETLIWMNIRLKTSFLGWLILNLSIICVAFLSIMGFVILFSSYTPSYSQYKDGPMHYYTGNSYGQKYFLHEYRQEGVFLVKQRSFDCNKENFEQCVNGGY